eukprot:77289-Pleurochrysis_carterae.AAC.1
MSAGAVFARSAGAVFARSAAGSFAFEAATAESAAGSASLVVAMPSTSSTSAHHCTWRCKAAAARGGFWEGPPGRGGGERAARYG